MAAERNFAAAAHCHAVDRGDDGFGRGLDAVDDLAETGLGPRRAEFANIRTAAEAAPTAENHDSPDLGIGLGLVERAHQTLSDGKSERVDGRVVQCDRGDGAMLFEFDHISHRRSPFSKLDFAWRNVIMVGRSGGVQPRQGPLAHEGLDERLVWTLLETRQF
jgi:hypothetical protein